MNLLRIATKVCIATDQSLAREIREKLLQKILSEFPSGYFEDKLYDTNEAGKGYKAGYVSFALKPLVWSNNNLIGGILIRGKYPSNVIKSTSPEPDTSEYKEWAKEGGNENLEGGEAETIELEAGYYNKKSSGSFQRSQDIGTATFTISALEEIEELVLDDESGLKKGIETIVNDVVKNPPDMAISAKKKTKDNPYTSLRKFMTHMNNEGKKKVTKEEVRMLADSTDQNYIKLVEKLNSFGFSVI